MTREELENQLEVWQDQYVQMKASVELQVMDWAYAKRQYFSAEPFFHEKQNQHKPKLLKRVPSTSRSGLILCGTDSSGRVLIEKELQDDPSYGWDRFYLYDDKKCTWELAYSKDGKLQYGRHYAWAHSELLYYFHKHLFGDSRFFKEDYTYEDGKIRSSVLTVDFVGRADQSKYEYTYTYHGQELHMITANVKHSYSKGYEDLLIYKNKTVTSPTLT